MHVQGIYKGYKASTRQPKGMYKAAKRGARHVQGKDLLGSQNGYKACTRYLGVWGNYQIAKRGTRYKASTKGARIY